MQTKKRQHRAYIILVMIITTLVFSGKLIAQNKSQYMRIAKIVVDPAKLDSFKIALKEGVETAVRLESGVRMLYALFEKDNPTHVTVFEIYANEDAYKLHIQTPHFAKYKTTVAKMVLSLSIADVDPIALAAKPGQ